MAYGYRSSQSSWGGAKRFNFSNSGSGPKNYTPKAAQPTGQFRRITEGSAQQEVIWSEMLNGETHIQVPALAGTGKTTTAVEGVFRLGPNSRYANMTYLAFNNSIKSEARTKLPEYCNVDTFHGFGFKAVGRFYNRRFNVEGDNVWNMLPDNMPMTLKAIIKNLVSKAKNTLTDPNDSEALLDLCARFDIDIFSEAGDITDQVLSYTRDIMERCKTPTGDIDFDDMIWLCCVHPIPLPKVDFLIIDEAQDLNASRQHIVMRLVQQGTRVMYIGDKNQAIYGFTGADVQGMDTLASLLQPTSRGLITLPLTVTRRCSKTVVALAQQIVPDFEAYPTNKDGFVCMGDSYMEITPSSTTTFKWKKYENDTNYCTNNKPQRGDMVICRVNAPLVQMAYGLIRQQVPCKIAGRDIGKGLEAVIKRLVPATASTASLLAKLGDYQAKEAEKINATCAKSPSRCEQQLQTLNDRVECIEALCDGLDQTSEVLQRINTLFQDVNGADSDRNTYVLLTSAHKSKGLEAEKVRVIEYQLMPHPMAKTPEARMQEVNLKYVAQTRSLDELHLHN